MRASDAIVAHARDAAPGECCGVLLGRDGAVVDAARTRNIAEDTTRQFVIDPLDHFAAIRSARQRGLEVIGFYHSHPASAPDPSPRDIIEFSYPGHLYAIVSLQSEPAEIRLFRFVDGTFQPVLGSDLDFRTPT